MKKILFAFLLISTNSFSQLAELDTFRIAAKNAQNDTTRLYFLNILTENEPDQKISIGYNDEMQKISQKNLRTNPPVRLKNIYLKYEGNSINNQGYFCLNNGEYDKAISFFEKSLKVYESINYKKGIGLAYNNIGLSYNNKGDNIKALEFYDKCMEILKQTDYQILLSSVLNNIGLIMYSQGNAPKALDCYHKSLKIMEQADDKKNISFIMNNIAVIYKKQGENDKAIEYYQKSLKLSEEIHDDLGIGYAMLGVATCLKNESKDLNSLDYDRKALAIFEKIGARKEVAQALGNIGVIYLTPDKVDSALYYLNKSLKISEEIGDKRMQVSCLCSIAKCYIINNKFKEAEKIGLKAMQMSKESSFLELLRRSSELMQSVYDKTNNPVKAYEMYKTFVKISDSINNNEYKKAGLKTQFKYEYGKKLAADSTKATEEKKLTDLKFEQEQNQRYVLYGGLISLLAFGGVMFNRFKVTKKQKNLIEIKNKETEQQKNIIEIKSKETEHQKSIIEEKQKEILDSINYAKRIQYTLLAHADFLKANLPDHFVLFEPKDIVSGDFYWATVHNDKFYLAVCDSTGHGVPGAFMSLLNIGFLSEAINEKGIEEPNLVLDYVRIKLIENISKEGQKDGFDGILMCFDKKTGKITYSAANNSPVLITNNEIMELEADRMPVGIGEKKEKFKSREIPVVKNSMLYLYTDGYADQFGGPKGKKYMYKRLNENLLSINMLTPQLQNESLKSALVEWKGKLEQVDDVCIIGIKL